MTVRQLSLFPHVPPNWLPPDRVIALTAAGDRPNSAETPDVETVVSCNESSIYVERARRLSCAMTPLTSTDSQWSRRLRSQWLALPFELLAGLSAERQGQRGRRIKTAIERQLADQILPIVVAAVRPARWCQIRARHRHHFGDASTRSFASV